MLLTYNITVHSLSNCLVKRVGKKKKPVWAGGRKKQKFEVRIHKKQHLLIGSSVTKRPCTLDCEGKLLVDFGLRHLQGLIIKKEWFSSKTFEIYSTSAGFVGQ
jgi:hypothetical protein